MMGKKKEQKRGSGEDVDVVVDDSPSAGAYSIDNRRNSENGQEHGHHEGSLTANTTNKLEEKRAMAVAENACCLCCLETAGTLILVLYLVFAMPQTFAWEKLLRTYGSRYDDCVDRSTDLEIELKSPEHCPYYFSIPCVPVISIVFLVLNFFCGSSHLSRPKSKKMFTMAGSVISWQFLFSIIAISFVSVYFYEDLTLLEKTMKRELDKGSLPETARWKLTQAINHCCGINKASDWNAKNQSKNGTNNDVKFPASCYANFNSSSTLHDSKSCLHTETATVKLWAILEICLLVCGLVTGVLFFCVARAIHNRATTIWLTSIKHDTALIPSDDQSVTADVVFVSNDTPINRGHLHFHRGHHLTSEDAESLGFSPDHHQQQQYSSSHRSYHSRVEPVPAFTENNKT